MIKKLLTLNGFRERVTHGVCLPIMCIDCVDLSGMGSVACRAERYKQSSTSTIPTAELYKVNARS